MGILTPIYSLALLLTLPIIALYFLKPKSEKKVIASHFLWHKTLDSINLQKMDKRLIRNWLFYLQLATIILGALYLMEPYIKQSVVESEDAILIIDSTSTMSTLSGDESRLEKSKTGAISFVEGLTGKSNITVYALEEDLKLLYKGTGKQQAINSIDKIIQSQVPAHPKKLQLLIDAHEESTEGSGIFIFSDRILSESDLAQHYLVEGGQNRVSIERVSHRRGDSEDYLQVTIVNKTDQPIRGELLLYGNETLLSIEDIELAAKEERKLSIDVTGHYNGYQLEWAGVDDYLLDNTYYYAVGQVTNKKILLTGDNNRFLEEAMMILPNVEVYKTDLIENIEGYDLYVFNGILPDKLPDKGSLLFVNPKGDASYLNLGKTYENGRIEFLKEDPLWRHVQLDFNVRQVRTIETVIGSSVMQIDNQPIISKGILLKRPTVIIGFDLLQSDFPIRIGFPVFMHNTANYLLGQLSRVQSNSELGSLVTYYGDPRASQRLLKGQDETIKLDDAAVVEIDPKQSGFYVLTEKDEDTLIKESLLAFNVSRAVEDVQLLEGHSDMSVLTVEQVGHQSLKWLVFLLLLVIILIEWWVYNHGY